MTTATVPTDEDILAVACEVRRVDKMARARGLMIGANVHGLDPAVLRAMALAANVRVVEFPPKDGDPGFVTCFIDDVSFFARFAA
jgi:hypothetical protein